MKFTKTEIVLLLIIVGLICILFQTSVLQSSSQNSSQKADVISEWIISDVSSQRSDLVYSTMAVQQDQESKLMKQEPQLTLKYRKNNPYTLDEKMSDDQLDNNYFAYLFHLDYTCEDYIRLGDAVDGGWDMCVVEPYRPVAPCLVYSFGINNDFSFDDAMSIKFGCTVRAFDPSMNVQDHRRNDNVWFYKTGIGGSDETNARGWKLRTLKTIINELGDTNKTIDYLKMDVEGSEWEALKALFDTDILQSRVKQLGLEIHVWTAKATANSLIGHWKILKQLENIGFKRWYWHFNHDGAYVFRGRMRTCCYELVYINTAFLRTESDGGRPNTSPVGLSSADLELHRSRSRVRRRFAKRVDAEGNLWKGYTPPQTTTGFAGAL